MAVLEARVVLAGLFLASTVWADPAATGQLHSRRCRIHEVRFSGNLGVPAQELRHALRATRARRRLPGLTSRPVFSQAAVQEDLERLRSLYLSLGYLDARVELAGAECRDEKTAITFSIESGPRYRVRALEVTAAGKSREIPPGADGQPSIRQLCRCLLDAQREAERQGSIDFDARLQANLAEDRQATLKATVKAGPPYTVGRIEFRGNHAVSDLTLRRALVLDEGALFDRERLLRSLVRLNRMGIFEPVTTASLEVAGNPETRRVDLTIQLRQKPRARWYITGPVGPPSVSGPLTAAVASRLPGWGRGLVEASTYHAIISVSAFANPFWRFLPSAPRHNLVPLVTLARPQLPGQGWTSGFRISPQLGWQGMLAGYGLGQLHRGVQAVLKMDSPGAFSLAVPVETIAPGGTGSRTAAGRLICEPARPRWSWLRTAGGIAADLLVAWPGG